MYYNYENIQYLLYNKILDNVKFELNRKHQDLINSHPLYFLLDYIKQQKYITLTECSQDFVYKLAKLALDGHMQLVEDECVWKKFCLDDKPTFFTEKSKWPDAYKDMFDKNPFAWGSDLINYDGAFTINVQYNDDNIKITIINDQDYKYNHNDGKIYFVFIVNIDDEENVLKVLEKFKGTIINRKVESDIKNLIDKIVDEISNNLIKKLYNDLE